MGFLQPDAAPMLLERRTARRWRATCAASLQTLTEENSGQLWDLSETGARLQIGDPPQQGSTAWLKWGSEKVVCRVVWIADDMCGVAFERPLNPAVVAETTRMIGEIEQPVATVKNIPVGRKRSVQHSLGLLSKPLDAAPSRLVLQLPRPKAPSGIAGPGTLTAAEEMFFYGSPLAHVLTYEANLSKSVAKPLSD